MSANLTSPEGVKQHMSASTSEDDWNKRAEQVKAAHNGDFPSFWFVTIMMSGVARQTSAKWGGDDEIKITSF